jgi:hypothetical protein
VVPGVGQRDRVSNAWHLCGDCKHGALTFHSPGSVQILLDFPLLDFARRALRYRAPRPRALRLFDAGRFFQTIFDRSL